MNNTKMFAELFSELEGYDLDGQKRKIEKMNEMIDRMNANELLFIYKEEQFNEMGKMIKEKKLSLENAFALMKRIGCNKALKFRRMYSFEGSFLNERFEKMIVEENKKKEEKTEKLFVDLCECFLLLNDKLLSKLIPICVPCVLKVASKKEENKENQKEVEMALLALSCVEKFDNLEQKVYLKEITEIIEHHQEHQNLTRLAYHSAWQFLMFRLGNDKSLEEVVVDELHFAREAILEFEKFLKCVDWKRKKEEERGKETKEVMILKRWLKFLEYFLCKLELNDEALIGVIHITMRLFLAANDNFCGISILCICILRNAVANRRAVKFDNLMNGGAVDAIFENIRRPTLNDQMTHTFLTFFIEIQRRSIRKEYNIMEEKERKAAKRKMFEKFEEEGLEDAIISFRGTFDFLNRKQHYDSYLFPFEISSYLVNA